MPTPTIPICRITYKFKYSTLPCYKPRSTSVPPIQTVKAK